jgi:hypothetical protein
MELHLLVTSARNEDKWPALLSGRLDAAERALVSIGQALQTRIGCNGKEKNPFHGRESFSS